MVKNFASNITELRKKKGISQKIAAKELGISQALLSHYENGIRECGLDFVVRAANYYQVSCDYLLGNSNSVISLDTMEKIKDIPEDKKFSTDTIFRASALIGARYVNAKNSNEDGEKIYAIKNYILLTKAIHMGFIPRNWIGDTMPNDMQLRFLNVLSQNLIDNLKKTTKPAKPQPVPECVTTITNIVNNLLNEHLAELIV